MSINESIRHYKTLADQGSELLLLRLRLLILDVSEQVNGLVKSFAAVAISAVLLLTALISLLFGLNTVLSQQAKAWVFFGIPVFVLLVVLALLFSVMNIWRNKAVNISQTLAEMQQDLACLRGSTGKQSVLKEQENG